MLMVCAPCSLEFYTLVDWQRHNEAHDEAERRAGRPQCVKDIDSIPLPTKQCAECHAPLLSLQEIIALEKVARFGLKHSNYTHEAPSMGALRELCCACEAMYDSTTGRRWWLLVGEKLKVCKKCMLLQKATHAICENVLCRSREFDAEDDLVG